MKRTGAMSIIPSMTEYDKEKWSRPTRYWYSSEIFNAYNFDNSELAQRV